MMEPIAVDSPSSDGEDEDWNMLSSSQIVCI